VTRSSCIAIRSCGDLEKYKHFKLSAKGSGRTFTKDCGKSLMRTMNKSGPRILPWGTPDKTGNPSGVD